LRPVLFPIFIYFYLDLLKRGMTQEAASFIDEHKKEHVESAFGKEVHSLVSLGFPEDISKNEVAKKFLDHRLEIMMSSYSHKLLFSFLHEHKLFLVLRVLNEHVNLRSQRFSDSVLMLCSCYYETSDISFH